MLDLTQVVSLCNNEQLHLAPGSHLRSPVCCVWPVWHRPLSPQKKHKLGRCTLWHSAFAQQIITIYPPACSVGPQRRHPFNSIQDKTLTGVQHPSQTSLLCHRSVVSQESCARESVEKQGCNSVASRWKNSIMLKLAFTGYICCAGRRWSRDSHLLPQPSLNTHPQSRTH